MSDSFQHWLFNQKERDDRIGELAQAMVELRPKLLTTSRKSDEHKRWADVITRHGEPQHVRAFNQAWREFQEANDEDKRDH